MPKKGKSRTAGKSSNDRKSRPKQKGSESAATATIDTATSETGLDASGQYVNQWNRLVSTTNWEKGRIICEWRKALESSGADPAEFSDDAWAALVGGVTGQHVGRLRRVYNQFGDVWQEYPGLFWSHFQVAMEWDDAEMWLEGALQNGWSVSQMRAARWEAHGAPAELKPSDADIIVGEIDEDALSSADLQPATPQTAAVRDPEAVDDEESPASDSASSTKRNKADDAVEPTEKAERPRPLANLPDLPDDVAEAFEQFKLVILHHKLAGWKEISRDDLLASLDALKELATLPAE